MDKHTFAALFETAISRSFELAGLAPQSSALVEYHGRPNPRPAVTVAQALDLLWLSPDRFYVVIDVSVILDGANPPLLFVRPSGHEPIQFSATWAPDDLGPFKAMGPMTKGGRT
jgi:hypothetical protein